MIDEALVGTSVTAVLIGAETSSRKWVRYEISKSYQEGKGLLGVYIHMLGDKSGRTDREGSIDFGEIGKDKHGSSVYFRDVAGIYDWKAGHGYANFGDWVEKAAKDAGK